jgi:hypothetical protein
LLNRGWSTEQITDHINTWVSRVIAYVVYLTREGYTLDQIVTMVYAAIDKADYDLSRMPIVP